MFWEWGSSNSRLWLRVTRRGGVELVMLAIWAVNVAATGVELLAALGAEVIVVVEDTMDEGF